MTGYTPVLIPGYTNNFFKDNIMTIKFHENVKRPFLNRFILGGLESPWNYGCAVSIYSGAQPTAQEIVDDWATYNTTSPNFLAHYAEGSMINTPSGLLLSIVSSYSATGGPWSQVSSKTYHSGVGSWGIFWSKTMTISQAESATVLPNANFLVLSVSDKAGDGVIRFQNTNFSTGIFNPIADGTISANLY